jgi:hypothetical protein
VSQFFGSCVGDQAAEGGLAFGISFAGGSGIFFNRSAAEFLWRLKEGIVKARRRSSFMNFSINKILVRMRRLNTLTLW